MSVMAEINKYAIDLCNIVFDLGVFLGAGVLGGRQNCCMAYC